MTTSLKNLLKSVSRSFYLSLNILPKTLQPATGIGYLFCRAADTVADTDLLPFEDRLRMLRRMQGLFQSFPVPKIKIDAFQDNLPVLPPTPEGRLLKKFGECMKSFHALTRTDQSLVQDVVLGVIKGMEKDLTTFGESSKTLKALKKERDLEDYLLWIGGEPGRFWTKLSIDHFRRLNITDRAQWIQNGIEFGKGLQMINILRDLPKDLQAGRCYIPEEMLSDHDLHSSDLLNEKNRARFLFLYHHLIDTTVNRLRNGLSYIYTLPRYAWRLRAAVWWPLVIGLRTLARLKDNEDILNPDRNIKISRWEVYGLIAMSLWILPSNLLLRWEFEDLEP